MFRPRFSWANFIVLILTSFVPGPLLYKALFCIGGTLLVNWISSLKYHIPLPRK